MLRNIALLVMVLAVRQSAENPAPNWPPARLSEPELLAGVAPCKCVDIRQCPPVLEILRHASASHGPAPSELNRLKRSTCGFNGFVPFVCCPEESSLEPRSNFNPNIITHRSPENIHKKSFSPDYFSHDYPDHSSEFHSSFVPSHLDPVSNSDVPYRKHSKPLSLDGSEEGSHIGKEESSYDDEEEAPYSSEEDLDVPSNTHFANHPPHFHEHLPEFSHNSKDFPEHSSGTRDPWQQKPEHKMDTTPSTTRCRGRTKTPVDVSVFSRGGVKELRQLDPSCEEDESSVDERDTVRNFTEILLEIQRASSSSGVRLLPGDQCGVTVDERIVGGKEAELGAFPWIARIGYTRNSSNQDGPFLYRCGGSLLNERYVLTAAHCVTKLPGGLELATVRLGEHDERTNPDCKTPLQNTCAEPVQDFRPETVTIHPQYDSPKYSSDVALIRLDRPARLSTYVSPICLPLWELGMKNYTGLKATVAGWGATHSGLTSSSPVLQWVRLGVVNARQCAVAYERSEVEIDSWRQLCAGGESMADSCDGDSGGPLMRPEQPSPDSLPRYFLVGVVSFGAKVCGTEDMPGVYTRVAAYLQWIVDTLKP